MLREEAIQRWIIPAIKNTWNEKKCKEILEALEQEPCEDCIGREEAKQFLYERIDRLNDDELYDIFSKVIDNMYNELPPVTPQPKTGYWMHTTNAIGDDIHVCSSCGKLIKQGYLNFCANCGCRMIEPQERSGEE